MIAAGRWDHTAALMAAGAWKPVNPAKLNPFRRRVKTAAQKEIEKVEGWMMLRAGLKAMAGGR